nr:hypothetical protein GCM10020093_008600 [Planobispora longispora]
MTDVRVVGDAGGPAGPGERGELFSRSPYLMSGYLDDPEATAACVTGDGYLTSGDVVVRDEEGYIYIVDRKKDMIISGGVNIAPARWRRSSPPSPASPRPPWWDCRTSAGASGWRPSSSPCPASRWTPMRWRPTAAPGWPGRNSPANGVRPLPPRNAAGKILKRELRSLGRPSGPAGLPSRPQSFTK